MGTVGAFSPVIKRPGREAKSIREVGLGVWSGFIWFRTGPIAGSCEHGHELSGSKEFWEAQWDILIRTQVQFSV
jgi:hypothetical protein